jgi:hypothetical protein
MRRNKCLLTFKLTHYRASIKGIASACAFDIADDLENGTNDSGLFPRDKPFEGLGIKP